MGNFNTISVKKLGNRVVYSKKCSIENKSYKVVLKIEQHKRVIKQEESIIDILSDKSAEEINFISLFLTPSEMIKENPNLFN